MKRISFMLPIALIKAFKIACAASGLTMSGVLINAIRQFVKDHGGAQ